MEGTFVACRPLQYGPEFPADMIDLHQVFEMTNQENDELLLRLRYVAQLQGKAQLFPCRECGRKFTDDFSRSRHGKIRHETAPGPPIVEDKLPKVDPEDPMQLEARARQLRQDLKRTQLADGMNVPNPDADIDKAAAEEEKLLNEIAPIPFENTTATRKAEGTGQGGPMLPEIKTGRRKVGKRTSKRGRK